MNRCSVTVYWDGWICKQYSQHCALTYFHCLRQMILVVLLLPSARKTSNCAERHKHTVEVPPNTLFPIGFWKVSCAPVRWDIPLLSLMPPSNSPESEREARRGISRRVSYRAFLCHSIKALTQLFYSLDWELIYFLFFQSIFTGFSLIHLQPKIFRLQTISLLFYFSLLNFFSFSSF